MKNQLLLILSVLSLTISYSQTFNDGVLEYTITDSENNYVSVVNYNGPCTDNDLIIPETVENETITYTVTSITSIINSAINCDITSVNIPKTVTSIENHAFSAYDLKEVIVNWTTPLAINLESFFGLYIYNIVLTVPEGSENAYLSAPVWEEFKTISNLDTFNDGILEYTIIDAINNYVSVKKYNDTCTEGDFVIPETIVNNDKTYRITAIGNTAFIDCEELTSVIIPEYVTSIDSYAFSGCTNLKSANIPENVSKIKAGVFKKCKNLINIVLPQSITSIGNNAFNNCSSLISINIPVGVTKIGLFTFLNCSSLISVIIPEGVTSIGKGAFSSCDNLINVTIPKSVTSIGEQAFSHCFFNLYKVKVNWDTPLSIYGNVFWYSSTVVLVVPAGTKSIYESSSWRVFGTIIEEGTIFNDGVLEYRITDTENNYVSVEKYNNICLEGEITIPETIDYNGITYKITAIENNAFSYCESLTSIIIPETVKSIGRSVFSYCINLESIKVNWDIPLIISTVSESFRNLETENISLYVPKETVQEYQTANVWKDFNIQEQLNSLSLEEFYREKIKTYPNPVEDLLYISLDNSVEIETIKLYNLQGQLIKEEKANKINISEFTSGIYLVEIETEKGKQIKKILKN